MRVEIGFKHDKVRCTAHFLWVICFTFILTSCGKLSGHSYKDLSEYVEGLKKTYTFDGKTSGSGPIYKLTLIEYKKSKRSPFDASENDSGRIAAGPLSSYSVNMLRFVGTMTDNGMITAYVMTPDGKVFKVTEGDHLGDHNGIVTRITTKQIDVMEKTMDDDSQSTQRIITLQLKEEG